MVKHRDQDEFVRRVCFDLRFHRDKYLSWQGGVAVGRCGGGGHDGWGMEAWLQEGVAAGRRGFREAGRQNSQVVGRQMG